MKQIFNYNEFYQRSLVLIGEADQLCVANSLADEEHVEKCTHWLFALVGSESDKATGRYEWNISVFPSKNCGGFNYMQPFYVSDAFQCIHEATEYVRELEMKAKNDQFCEITIDSVKAE
ncbi:hypothetical protein [Pseudalkalibacillus decolorationis]|uniref:hypothetical protein n=1 Tax=Pseudalkalibacillus decolorationis TaxID=163879 RepID=UPI00214850C3|nr:hypothetical protein [Pseudalkalibacillus decolorationis]